MMVMQRFYIRPWSPSGHYLYCCFKGGVRATFWWGLKNWYILCGVSIILLTLTCFSWVAHCFAIARCCAMFGLNHNKSNSNKNINTNRMPNITAYCMVKKRDMVISLMKSYHVMLIGSRSQNPWGAFQMINIVRN